MGLRCSQGYGSWGALGSRRVIWRSGLTWGYGSGLHLWATGNPNPLPGRNQPVHSNTTPHPPSYPQTAPHVPSYPLRPHATPRPRTHKSHLYLTPCLLLQSTLLLQAVVYSPISCPNPPMFLDPQCPSHPFHPQLCPTPAPAPHSSPAAATPAPAPYGCTRA